MKTNLSSLIAALLLSLTPVLLAADKKSAASIQPGHGPYLFAGFKGNGEDGAYFAISDDGYHWTLVNDGKPVVKPTVPGELMRDPFIQRAPDGSFRMVWTWAWRGQTIGYSSSTDLVHWASHQQLAVFANEPTATNVWAPALYYKPEQKEWLICWSSSVPDRFPDQNPAKNGLNHRIYSTNTTDFKTFEPARMFFNPEYSVIDATLFPARGKYYLVFKDEQETPLQKHIMIADSVSIEGPYMNISAPFTETWSEGPAAIQVGDSYIVYYDHYRDPQHYGAALSRDLFRWIDITSQISFPPGLRHGSFLQITSDEGNRLRALKPSK